MFFVTLILRHVTVKCDGMSKWGHGWINGYVEAGRDSFETILRLLVPNVCSFCFVQWRLFQYVDIFDWSRNGIWPVKTLLRLFQPNELEILHLKQIYTFGMLPLTFNMQLWFFFGFTDLAICKFLLCPWEGAKYCDQHVSVSVCWLISKTTCSNFTKFVYMLPVAVARSCCDDSAIILCIWFCRWRHIFT